jgi:hypothetical protein
VLPELMQTGPKKKKKKKKKKKNFRVQNSLYVIPFWFYTIFPQ